MLMSLAGNRSEDFYTNREVLDAINRQRELNFTPGSEYLYSNAGYFLLGEIVARVSGQSLREFAETEFFGPLGMTHTHFHDDHNEIVRNRAIGYVPTDDGFRINVTTLDMVGDGGIFTSVEEWFAWDRNLTEGTVGGPEWVALMHERGVLNSGDTIPYAFGIAHGRHRGLATVGHGGSWVGYRAAMSRYPDAGYSFVALCNRSRIDPGTLIASTAEFYLEDRMEPPEEAADGRNNRRGRRRGGGFAGSARPRHLGPHALRRILLQPRVEYHLSDCGGRQRRAHTSRGPTQPGRAAGRVGRGAHERARDDLPVLATGRRPLPGDDGRRRAGQEPAV